jgi:putative ABC transport system permease protein
MRVRSLRLIPTLASIALRRLWANAGLALCALLALVVAVALAVSVPVYAEAASLRVLQDELARQEAQQGRSPFALLARYVASQNQNRTLPWSAVAAADTLFSGGGLATLGPPLVGLARHARSEPLRLALPATGGAPSSKTVSLGFLTGLDGQVRRSAGELPAPATTLDTPIDALISGALANEVGLNVGDELRVLATVRGRTIALPLRVAGVWEPINPRDPAWPLQTDSFRDMLLLDEASFTGPVASALETPVSQVLWYARLDPGTLTPTQAAPLLGQVEQLRAAAASALPGLRIEQGPAEPLSRYRRAADRLTLQLAVVAAPTLALVMAFVVLVAGLLAQRQAAEVALLKTRGVADSQLLAIAASEWLLLGAVALLVGPGIGLMVARVIAATASFLELDPTLPPLAGGMTTSAWGAALLVVALAVCAALVPTAAATRRTLADNQRRRARALRAPAWQRIALDGFLLLLALIGLFLLRQGNPVLGGRDPVANPLLLAVPTLLCLSLGLLVVRLVPHLFALLAHIASVPNWVGPLLALRTLARQPESYRGALFLLVLTLSLASVSASVAATADTTLHAAISYRVGAQTQLIETGESTETPEPGGQAPERRDIREEPRFLFVPVSERLTVPGIVAASRVGHYAASLRLGGVATTAQLIGVDRLTLPQVAPRFDPTWADGESLGGLMNRLAATPNGVLVSRSALERGLRLGDRLAVTAELFGDRRELTLLVVGVVDLWPGVNPQEGPILVMNLDALFDQMGGQYPFNVWIARDPAVPLASLSSGVRQLGVNLVDVLDTEELTRAEQARPQRQGMFGMLSVGFVGAGGLALTSFVLGALLTARRRSVELGTLRALGLGSRPVLGALLLEQGSIILAGLGGGLLVGVVTVLLVVPAMTVRAGPWPGMPPVPTVQPWGELALLALVAAVALVVTLLALVAIQARLRLAEAVKLSEVA